MASKACFQSEWLIRGGTVVTAEDQVLADVHIIGEKIQAVGPEASRAVVSAERILDATGCYVFPGGIDPHTHMELPLPSTQSSDSFESGTAAALHGGTTTIIDFANQWRGGTLKEALSKWRTKADGNALCDYGLHLSITEFTKSVRDELPGCVRAGVPSFKIFTAYKGTMQIDDRQILQVMESVHEQGGLVLAHAENGDLIDHLVARHRVRNELAPKFHALSRPTIAEAEATSRLIDLAAQTHCPLYIVHLSAGEALERARAAVARNRVSSPVYLETCIQYLLLTSELYEQPGFDGAKYVLSPPLRSASDLQALWKGLADNVIEVLATDHCPFTLEQRRLGIHDFTKIPNGLAGVEHRMELLFSEGVSKGRLPLSRFVELTSTAAARIFGLYPKKGTVEAGSDADLVIFDPTRKKIISAASHHMHVDYSVYEGREVTGVCRTVMLRGQVAVHEGELKIGKGFGKFLVRSTG